MLPEFGMKSMSLAGRISPTQSTMPEERFTLRQVNLVLKLFIESDKILPLCSCGIVSKTCRKDLLYGSDHPMSIVGRVSHPDAPEQILAGVVSFKSSKSFQC